MQYFNDITVVKKQCHEHYYNTHITDHNQLQSETISGHTTPHIQDDSLSEKLLNISILLIKIKQD